MTEVYVTELDILAAQNEPEYYEIENEMEDDILDYLIREEL